MVSGLSSGPQKRPGDRLSTSSRSILKKLGGEFLYRMFSYFFNIEETEAGGAGV